jgi:curved DNA-binding protein CbpA
VPRRRRRDPYRLLGVSRSASAPEIWLAYARRRTWDAGAQRRDLDTAYRVLRRPATRARYDRLHRASCQRLAWMSFLGGAGVLAALVALILGSLQASPDANQPAGSGAAPPTPSPAGPPPALLPPQPAASAITLTTDELPPGYHLLSQGPAQFGQTGGGQPAPSWDAVFAADSPSPSERRLVESLVVVYASPEQARQALNQVDEAETAATAASLPPPAGLGTDAREWVERAPGGRPYAVIRIAWVSRSVVSQVSLLEVAGPDEAEQAADLAFRQQGDQNRTFRRL